MIKENPKLIFSIFLFFLSCKRQNKDKREITLVNDKMLPSSRMWHFNIGTQLLDLRKLS
jgi:hypothetical protein